MIIPRVQEGTDLESMSTIRETQIPAISSSCIRTNLKYIRACETNQGGPKLRRWRGDDGGAPSARFSACSCR
uniref:Uncharacterized protein n=1 Tax=Aegilops tauschii subsp. strangulata TaxID=200361 RepID=A0A452ZZY3_AEGTS